MYTITIMTMLMTVSSKELCDFDDSFIANKWECYYMGGNKLWDMGNPCTKWSHYSPSNFEINKKMINGKMQNVLYPGRVGEKNYWTGNIFYKYTFTLLDFSCNDKDNYTLKVGVYPYQNMNKIKIFMIIKMFIYLLILISLFTNRNGNNGNYYRNRRRRGRYSRPVFGN